MGQYYGSMVSVKENFGFRCNKKNMNVQKQQSNFHSHVESVVSN